jgi:A/G-specific adenine glycosylase
MDYQEFQEEVWAKGREHYRSMPWRDTPTFYHVLVSELMLQQTQVERVRTKFAEFMSTFPTIEALGSASLADVLRVWQGLGYNRRAKFLHQAAQYVVAHGQPSTLDGLIKLPGVGANTAGAIMNYVYEVPTAFIETNIRTVYFSHFFTHQNSVSDVDLKEIVHATIDRESPREWFYALMDYGAYLKANGQGKLDVSKHYKKQSPLRGSVREVRGDIIRRLAAERSTKHSLEKVYKNDARFDAAYQSLIVDGLIIEDAQGNVELTK